MLKRPREGKRREEVNIPGNTRSQGIHSRTTGGQSPLRKKIKGSQQASRQERQKWRPNNTEVSTTKVSLRFIVGEGKSSAEVDKSRDEGTTASWGGNFSQDDTHGEGVKRVGDMRGPRTNHGGNKSNATLTPSKGGYTEETEGQVVGTETPRSNEFHSSRHE